MTTTALFWALVFSPAPAAAQSADQPAPRLIENTSSIEPQWLKRHEDLAALAKKGGARVLFLGDSITEYWHDNAVWRARYAPLPAANFGVAGDTTQNVLWRLAQGELTGERPAVVVLLIGTNNLGGGGSPDETARGVGAVVRAVRRLFPEARILLLGIFPRGQRADDPLRARVRRTNAALAELDNGAWLRYADVGPALLEGDGSLSPEVMPDFLHPSEEGYRRWADAMDPHLRILLAPSARR
jgi:lysophospholipase L1-like esterase